MGDTDPNSRGLDSSINNVFQANKDGNNGIGTQPSVASCNDPRLISDDGICGNCLAENALEDSICCLECELTFHACCFDVKKETSRRVYRPDNACSKTFLDSLKQLTDSKKKNKRFGNFLYVCDPCMTTREHKKASNLKSHVQTLETKMTSMENDIATIKNLLENASNTLSPASSTGSAEKLSPPLPHAAKIIHGTTVKESKTCFIQ